MHPNSVRLSIMSQNILLLLNKYCLKVHYFNIRIYEYTVESSICFLIVYFGEVWFFFLISYYF